MLLFWGFKRGNSLNPITAAKVCPQATFVSKTSKKDISNKKTALCIGLVVLCWRNLVQNIHVDSSTRQFPSPHRVSFLHSMQVNALLILLVLRKMSTPPWIWCSYLLNKLSSVSPFFCPNFLLEIMSFLFVFRSGTVPLFYWVPDSRRHECLSREGTVQQQFFQGLKRLRQESEIFKSWAQQYHIEFFYPSQKRT